jgi:hypothetical protein
LPQIYARYDVKDMWRALFAAMALYRCLVAETAALLGYDYAADVDTQVTAWIERCFAERDKGKHQADTEHKCGGGRPSYPIIS